MGARQAPLRPPPPLRCGSPAADPAWRRPLAGSARPSSGRARANLRRLVHHPRPARVALPARAASTSCSTAVAPRRRWRGSSPFSKAELVLPRSARGRQARARASRRLLELRGTRPPSTPLHPLVPPLHSQVCARPDCRGSGRILKDWLPLPRPPRRPPGVWLTTRKNWPLGCSGSPGPRVRPGRLPPALCVRAAKLSEETPCGYAARGGMIKGTIGGGGVKGDSPHWGATRASCCTQASQWPCPEPPPPPASPPLQGQSKPGRGGARPQGRARSGASGAAGKGLWLVWGFAKPVWEGNRESRGEVGKAGERT